VRDYVLGVKVLDGRGRALRLGGTVFKNVAGFDGFRLMAGALGCLGALLEVSVRVAPKPRADAFLAYETRWPEAQARLTGLLRSPLPISGAMHDGARLHLRLSGAEAAVKAAARDLGGETEPGAIWEALRHMRMAPLDAPRLWRLSVPRLARTEHLPGVLIRDWAGAQIWLSGDVPPGVARAAAAEAGGHATLFRGATAEEEVFTALPAPLFALHQRLKAAFDPAGVFNPGRMYEGL
jgi:glycolate oxidase FAD binding subunit